MTILEAKSLFYSYFSKNHSFSLEKNFTDIIRITDNRDLDNVTLTLALEDLVKTEVLRFALVLNEKGDSERTWILSQPLDACPQTVVLNHATVTAIVELLILASEQLKTDSVLPDPLNIREKDIQNILILLQNSLKK